MLKRKARFSTSSDEGNTEVSVNLFVGICRFRHV